MTREVTKFLANESTERLDRFELIAELASGGMATVFLARLSGVAGFQRLVAIKRLHPHLADDHDFIEMFLDEARLAARLHHPNVVPILEIGESETGYYLVMEYVEGDTLAHLMARSAQSGKPLPTKVAVRTALDALAGLDAAHELTDDEGKPLEIVHRDVSPQNILVGVDGSAKITDFGVARAASRLTTTKSGQLKGKLSYMAPEQARGKGIDRRSDVFAMGIVLWELLARKRLFKGDGEADTLNKVINDPISNLRDVNPEVSEALAAVCMKALERDMDARWPTAAAFADALETAAIASGVMGSHRDVAAHLDAVIGTDISQQRDAVRAWIARSEPSKHGDPRLDGPHSGRNSVPKLPRDQASMTRIDGTRRSISDATPASAVSRSTPLPVPNPHDVSSVSSTILSAAGGTPLAVPRKEKSRAPLFAVIAVLVVVILAGGAYEMKHHRDGSTVATQSTVPESVHVVPPQVAPEPTALAATLTTTADSQDASIAAAMPSATAASAQATDKAPRTTRGRGHSSPSVTATPPPPATSSSAMPDDISHNPYR